MKPDYRQVYECWPTLHEQENGASLQQLGIMQPGEFLAESQDDSYYYSYA